MEIKAVVFCSTDLLEEGDLAALRKISSRRSLYISGQGDSFLKKAGAQPLVKCSSEDLAKITNLEGESILLVSSNPEALLAATRANIKIIALSENPATLPEEVRSKMTALVRSPEALGDLLR